MGKTSLALTLIDLLCSQGVQCMFASIEMPRSAICQRFITLYSGVPFNDVPAAAVSTPIMSALSRFAQLPLFIEDGNLTVEQLAAKVRVAKRRWGIRVLVVDYVQLMRSSSATQKRGDRRMEVGEVSTTLNEIKRELEIPVIALAQLSREQEKRGNKPKFSDLKESGDLEQDADLIAFLYESSDDREHNDTDEESAEPQWRRLSLDIAKQRNGRTGHIPLHFERRRMRFFEYVGHD